mmetsp:Transcript_7540/g.18557  ORF Transcript_7540/g.18557 Transcript_7540/m.18557 type:complete len:87 (-) Transcript_7540:42-302(-)
MTTSSPGSLFTVGVGFEILLRAFALCLLLLLLSSLRFAISMERAEEEEEEDHERAREDLRRINLPKKIRFNDAMDHSIMHVSNDVQ